MTLHPLSILYQIVAGRGLRVLNFFVTFVLLAPILLQGDTSSSVLASIAYVLIALGVIYLVYICWEILYFRRFRFGFQGDRFEIRSGVFFQRERDIPLDRIQNVDVNRSLVQRLLGLSEVRIESAGGGETEAILQCVTPAAAERIRDRIHRTRTDPSAGETRDGDDERTGPPDIEYRLSGESYLLLCLFSMNPRGIYTGLWMLPLLLVVGLLQGVVYAMILLLIIGFAGTAVMWSIGAARTFATYYGFKLQKHADKLTFERGLIQRRTGSIPLDKVQKLIVRENVLMRLFGFAALQVETAGYAPGTTMREFAVPLARRRRVLEIAHEIKPFRSIRVQRPPERVRTRYAFRLASAIAGVTALLFGLSYYAGLQASEEIVIRYLWTLPLVLLPCVFLPALLVWRQLGYRFGKKYAIFREGFWIRTTMIVPYFRMQTLITRQTLFQRFWDLSTLTIDTAGSYGAYRTDASAVDIDATAAKQYERRIRTRFREQLVDRVRRRSTRSNRLTETDGEPEKPGEPPEDDLTTSGTREPVDEDAEEAGSCGEQSGKPNSRRGDDSPETL